MSDPKPESLNSEAEISGALDNKSEKEKPIISIVGLQKQFSTKAGVVNALNGIDLDIYPGEIFGIIGM
ncbi:MAG: methionine ABC transporter ATP-binding protein, partial [Firmicutes bacterium]|nr:methionine ABC transporter ATP-binding protein [Bacillota bacterium]